MNVVGDERRALFEREILPHLDALYTFGAKLTRDRHTAEDLVSDTILRAFDRWEQYTLGTNARAWLFTILYHLFIGRVRSANREVPLPELLDASPHYEIVGDPDPAGAYFDSIIDEELPRAIEPLPENYREAVLLRDPTSSGPSISLRSSGFPKGRQSRLFRVACRKGSCAATPSTLVLKPRAA